MQISSLQQQPALITPLTQLLFREWAAYPNWNNPGQIEARLQARNLPSVKTLTLVATAADGALMASASLIQHELTDVVEREFWLGEVITAPEHRGKGVGSALISRMITEARARNISALWLYTPDQQALYQRFGWQDVEQREVDSDRVSVMMLRL
ncbi:MAG: GNAT family N-acetyltransferase [Pantoea sp.]|uniref:GNAT family N-acetyltransferase n=1 Tax=Pantoea sp. TaxID=69393 RepID=UPI0039E6DB02